MSKCKIQAGDTVTIRQGVAFYDWRVTHACKDRLEVEEKLSFVQSWNEKTKGAIIDRLKWTIEIHRAPRKAKKQLIPEEVLWSLLLIFAGLSMGYTLGSLFYKLFN